MKRTLSGGVDRRSGPRPDISARMKEIWRKRGQKMDLENHHTFYGVDNADDIAHLLHTKGLHNLSEYIKDLKQAVLDAEEGQRAAEDEWSGHDCSEEEYQQLREKLQTLKSSVLNRMKGLSKPKDTKAYKELVNDIVEAIEILL